MSLDISYSGGVFSAPQAKSVGTVTAGTGPYNLAVASYDSVSFFVGTQDTVPTGLTFSTDGTNAYVAGPSQDKVFQYTLSTAWDLSTASYAGKSLTVSGQATLSGAIAFKDDGTSLYVLDRNTDDVFQYDLTIAWDVSTASYASKSMDATSQDTAPRGMYFKPDGTKVYIAGDTNASIFQYALSTAWDISTGSYESKSFSVNTQTAYPCGVYLSADGYKMFVAATTEGDIFQYSLSTAWDVSTASYDSVSFDASTQVTTGLHDLYFKSDGSKMYLISNSTDTIYQYSTGTATTLDLSTGNYFSHTPSVNTVFAFSNAPASGTAAGFALALTGANVAETYDLANASYDSVSLSVSTQENDPRALFFKPDGTKMFVTGSSSDAIQEYSLSTAWDLSTASRTTSFSVASQEANPQGLFFKPDGTKFWITGNSDRVWEYSLSTAWDVSTASYSSLNLATSAQAGLPVGVAFKPDGTKMYIVDNQGTKNAYQYSLSNAWQVNSASYDSVSFSVSALDANIQDITFNNDGTKMYIVGGDGNNIYQHSLSTAWDLSTASYDSISFSFSSQTLRSSGAFFKPDGTKLYVSCITTNALYQYTTGSTATATFTYPSSVKFPSGTAPAGPAIGETDVLVFYTDDGGTTYQGFRAGNAMS